MLLLQFTPRGGGNKVMDCSVNETASFWHSIVFHISKWRKHNPIWVSNEATVQLLQVWWMTLKGKWKSIRMSLRKWHSYWSSLHRHVDVPNNQDKSLSSVPSQLGGEDGAEVGWVPQSAGMRLRLRLLQLQRGQGDSAQPPPRLSTSVCKGSFREVI